jgi:sigma-B regulation protein RsbU (phosphoserine phosphatase)
MYGDEYNWMDAEAGFVLAGLPDISYTSQYIQLTHGSRIFLYTDGVTEAQNEAQELFGEDALLESLKKNGKLPLQKMLAGVRADIDEFAGAAEQFDDITMLALEYK